MSLMQVTNRKALSGVTFHEGERARLFLDLAYADSKGLEGHRRFRDEIACCLPRTRRSVEPPTRSLDQGEL